MSIFISHSWHDKPLAFRLATALRRLGPSVEVWHDCENLRLGNSILDNVETALANADVVAVIWSHDGASSAGVAHELRYASQTSARLVLLTVSDPDDGPPELPPEAGRLPLGIELEANPSDERVDLTAAALLEVVVEQLAADPEVGLPGSEAAQQPVRGLGATLRHLLARTASDSVQRQRQSWTRVLSGERRTMTRSALKQLDDLGSGINLMNEVVDAVAARPTDPAHLHRLRQQAEELRDRDPTGAAQAIKVLDLRLADPLF